MTKCVHAIAVAVAGTVVTVGSTAVAQDAVLARARTVELSVDCRATFPVYTLDNDPALSDLRYSAVGWDLAALPAENRTVSIVARPGSFVGGVFSPDAGGELTVLSEGTGAGTCSWAPSSVSKKIYRLEHLVYNKGILDATGTLYGYMDFTHCVSHASQEDVERAVVGEVTHSIAVVQDEVAPWQPIDTSTARSGIATEVGLPAETETATTFRFAGHGTLNFEYRMDGGTLSVWLDGVKVSELDTASEWTSQTLSIEAFSAHEVVLLYTVAGDCSAAIRNVRWSEVAGNDVLAGATGSEIRADFQGGVRTPKYLFNVLPFTYSSTNWLGDVKGATDVSLAQVAIVQMTGDDPDVRNWTEEVPGTSRVLKQDVGEGEVMWRARSGVWKATFDILNGNTSIYQETALFDLRNSTGRGLILYVR